MFARLSRIVPMLIVLAVVAAIVYIVAAWRYSPNRAKELLIRIFTAIERNGAVFDLSFSFLLTALIGLAVTRICRAVFLRHNPAYLIKAAKTTTPGSRVRRWRKK